MGAHWGAELLSPMMGSQNHKTSGKEGNQALLVVLKENLGVCWMGGSGKQG